MKILIIISSFYMGGFSKSLINFLRCAEPYLDLDITVLSMDENKKGQEKEIPSRYRHIELNGLEYAPTIKKGFNAQYIFNIQRLRNAEYKVKTIYYRLIGKTIPQTLIKRFIQYDWINRANRVVTDFSFAEKYDCVISWEEGFCNYLLVDKIPSKHKIGYIHPNYKEIYMSDMVDRKYMDALDRVVAISGSCYETLRDVFPQFKDKIVYLPNRLHIETLEVMANKYMPIMDYSTIKLVTVARMVDYDKAIFRIVELMKHLRDDGINAKWYVVGDGVDLPELKKRIEESDLSNRIICVGELQNPCPYMKEADLFVMQSNREGRPVAVDEAMALGTSALITNYSSAEEQVVHGVSGWIVDNKLDCIYEQLKDILIHREKLISAREYLRSVDRKHYESCDLMVKVLEDVVGGT